MYFDLRDRTEAALDITTNNSFRYIKLIPTAFREKPINYTSKPFNSNQVEIQFFGVNGYDLGHDSQQVKRSTVEHVGDSLSLNGIKALNVSINATLEDKV